MPQVSGYGHVSSGYCIKESPSPRTEFSFFAMTKVDKKYQGCNINEVGLHTQSFCLDFFTGRAPIAESKPLSFSKKRARICRSLSSHYARKRDDIPAYHEQ